MVPGYLEQSLAQSKGKLFAEAKSGAETVAVKPHGAGNYRNRIRKINVSLVECRTSQGG